MKLKQLFENSNNQFLKTRKEIEAWLQKMKIKNYTIRDDLMVDVDGDVDLSYQNLSFIPVKFWEVGGDFDCSHQCLQSLKGAPREVGGDFDCSYTCIKSLEGGLKEVGGDFKCNDNSQLENLKGVPRKVGGYFICFDNPSLTDDIDEIVDEIYEICDIGKEILYTDDDSDAYTRGRYDDDE